MTKEYLPRIIDIKLELYLRTFGAVLIEGPKWCGKTTTASKVAKSKIKMQEPSQLSNNLRIANSAPQLLLEGDTPRLIDEWQVAPILWDAVRDYVDEKAETGMFILTGSTTPPKNSVMHTGTGRFGRLLMRPMSLYESKESNGKVSLNDLFLGENILPCKSDVSINQLAYLICRGGWPQAINKNEESSYYLLKNM